MSTYVFGDSFIGPFKLIADKNIKIYKFKGATLKGLTKENNENRIKIEDVVTQANKKGVINCMIFIFLLTKLL